MKVFLHWFSFPATCLCMVHCFMLPLTTGFFSFMGVAFFSETHGSHILAWLTALSMLPVAMYLCVARLRETKCRCLFSCSLSIFALFFLLGSFLSLGFSTDTSFISDILITSGSILTILSLHRHRKRKEPCERNLVKG